MFKWPPSQSHGGMKLVDIFLLSSRTAPSAISSAALYGEEISDHWFSTNLECLSKVGDGAGHLNATWVPFENLDRAGWGMKGDVIVYSTLRVPNALSFVGLFSF